MTISWALNYLHKDDISDMPEASDGTYYMEVVVKVANNGGGSWLFPIRRVIRYYDLSGRLLAVHVARRSKLQSGKQLLGCKSSEPNDKEGEYGRA